MRDGRLASKTTLLDRFGPAILLGSSRSGVRFVRTAYGADPNNICAEGPSGARTFSAVKGPTTDQRISP